MARGTDGPPVKKLSEPHAAYIAGLIDGEGCIRAGFVSTGIVSASLTVSMTDAPTMRWLHDTVGAGCLRTYAPKKHYRRAWRFILGAHRAADLLRQITPHMITKRREAELFVELMDLRATLNHGSRSRGQIRGTSGRPSKFSMAPDQHLRLISGLAQEKRRDYGKAV